MLVRQGEEIQKRPHLLGFVDFNACCGKTMQVTSPFALAPPSTLAADRTAFKIADCIAAAAATPSLLIN